MYGQNDSNVLGNKYAYKSYIVPVSLIVYGLTCWGNNGLPSSQLVYEFRNNNFNYFKTPIDDYMVFAPCAIMYGLDLFKVKSRSDLINQIVITAKSMALSLAVINVLKYTTQISRPDGSADNSFASGHSAAAFTLAEVLHQEFKNKPWLYISGYAAATSVASMRILNNKHWLSDVLVGAGLGMAATKLVYATHKNRWKLGRNLLPTLGSNQVGMLYKF